MARPKKVSSEELVALVDEYFTGEAGGNPSKLKCSLLEAYAQKKGVAAKAYDFRRDKSVRKRLDELKLIVKNENGLGLQIGAPYKSLDIDRLLKARRDPDELRKIIGELDAYWKQIYEGTLSERKDAGKRQEELMELERARDSLSEELSRTKTGLAERKTEINKLVVENRYLRKMLKTYLYPALANEILVKEQQLKNPDTQVTQKAAAKLIDGKFPSALSEATDSDRKDITEEERILQQMMDAVPEV